LFQECKQFADAAVAAVSVSLFVSAAADSREMKRESKAQGQPMEMSQKCRQNTAQRIACASF
jgi:hypothetical protein